MFINIDKRFIEILNKRGYEITWEQFLEAYSLRKKEREKTRKKHQKDLSFFESMFFK